MQQQPKRLLLSLNFAEIRLLVRVETMHSPYAVESEYIKIINNSVLSETYTMIQNRVAR